MTREQLVGAHMLYRAEILRDEKDPVQAHAKIRAHLDDTLRDHATYLLKQIMDLEDHLVEEHEKGAEAWKTAQLREEERDVQSARAVKAEEKVEKLREALRTIHNMPLTTNGIKIVALEAWEAYK